MLKSFIAGIERFADLAKLLCLLGPARLPEHPRRRATGEAGDRGQETGPKDANKQRQPNSRREPLKNHYRKEQCRTRDHLALVILRHDVPLSNLADDGKRTAGEVPLNPGRQKTGRQCAAQTKAQ
jgi:hypothetical protein